MPIELEKLLRSLLPELGASRHQTVWKPSVDIYHSEHEWIIKVELAGVRAEDIQILLSENSVAIRGRRRDGSIQEGQTCYSLEITYDRFERTIQLPFQIEPNSVKTEYRDGMLLIRIRPVAVEVS